MMMKNTSRLMVGLIAALVLVFACASPDWSGMSESQIAEWKADGATPAIAKQWIDKGFNAADYKAWSAAGFDLDDASKWSKKQFSPTEAAAWSKGGFSVGDAEESRSKGLSPIPPVAPTTATE